MTKISKMFKTESAHRVVGAYTTRCQNIHGHSYKWIVTISGPCDKKSGMVVDFGRLKPIKDFVDQFDHAMILWSKDDKNFIQFFKDNVKRYIIMRKNTTAENMARMLHKYATEWLSKEFGCIKFGVDNVQVWETATGSAIAIKHDENDVIDEFICA